MISLVASVLVLYHIVRNKQKRKVYHQIMTLIAMFDVVTSLVWIVGTAAVDEYYSATGQLWSIYGAKGTEDTCTASGFFLQLGELVLIERTKPCSFNVL